MEQPKKKEQIDCHVNEEECLLPAWAKKLRAILREGARDKDDRTGRQE